MSVFVQAVIPGELGEERGEVPVGVRGRAGKQRASSIMGVMYLDGGGSEDRIISESVCVCLAPCLQPIPG